MFCWFLCWWVNYYWITNLIRLYIEFVNSHFEEHCFNSKSLLLNSLGVSTYRMISSASRDNLVETRIEIQGYIKLKSFIKGKEMFKSLLILIQKTNVTFFFSLLLPSINLKIIGTHKHKHTCVHTHKGILCIFCLSHSFHTYFKTSFLLITNGPLTGDPVSHWSPVIAAFVP